LAGKPLLQHVFDRVRACRELAFVCIATDDARIRDAARGFGAEVVMTASHHPSGTDRIAEAVRAHPEATHVVNIQGDEPLIDPALIDSLAAALVSNPALPMITAANPVSDPAQLDDPDIVKVVLDRDGCALYFSRRAIPYRRSAPSALQLLRHMGIYGYRRDFLEQFVQWPPGILEQTEHLEQLRALENGARIRVIITADNSLGLDTPEQVPQLEALLAAAPSPP
jgi:3-deoxy-manno-octulosonate cytidylyltransferase (CMP-KDO synthetase)